MLTIRLAFAVMALFVLPGAVAGDTLVPRKDIFMAAAGFRPAISPSGSWIAEAGAAPGTVLLTRTDSDAKPKVIALGTSRIYWYRWATGAVDGLLLGGEKNGQTVIYRIDPASGDSPPVTSASDQPVMSVATYTNGYAFTYDRFKDKESGQVRDLDREGKLVVVEARANAVPAYLGIKDGFLDLRVGREGQTFLFGSDPEHRGEARLSPQDQRMGSSLVSVTADSKAYLLSSGGVDTLRLIELDLRAGTQKTLAQDTVDIRRVILNPLDLAPDAVELERTQPELTILNERIGKDVARLTGAGWGFPRIVDRSPNDKYWIVKYASVEGAPTWTVYDRSKSTIRPVRLASPGSAAVADWNVRSFTVARPDEPELRGYVTMPRLSLCPAGRCPLVLKLHGGPAQRDYAETDQERYWLLNRGIAVATLNYRGSRGFGKQFEALDQKQWASGIPKDVQDGLAHVLKNYPIDPARVAVMGTSFSGYLALNLASRNPQIKCAVIDSATTDMAAFVDEAIQKNGDKSDLIERLGDAREPKARAELVAMSPASRTEQLKKLKLLQFHGGRDRTTPQSNNQAFIASLLTVNPHFSYVAMPNEGHGLLGARADYYAMAEQFLGQCIDVKVEPLDAADLAHIATFDIQGNKTLFPAPSASH